MKKFEIKTTNRSLLVYTLIMLLIWFCLSLYFHDFDKFKIIFIYATAPGVYLFFFGENTKGTNG